MIAVFALGMVAGYIVGVTSRLAVLLIRGRKSRGVLLLDTPRARRAIGRERSPW